MKYTTALCFFFSLIKKQCFMSISCSLFSYVKKKLRLRYGCVKVYTVCRRAVFVFFLGDRQRYI